MLKLIKLTKTYKTGDQALKAVSLEIPAGQVLALIGPSGAGKSTLIRCINQLVKPTSGQVILEGVDVTALNSAGLRRERRQRVRRERELGRLGGVEETVQLAFLDEVIHARAEEDVDRTNAEGKASSVQFLHFPFNDEQIAKFRSMEGEVQLRITHPAYHHIAVLSETTRRELARDLDG